ncbi:MAG: hypothetical protein US70_C0015G0007 [Parcubacteria group bacterium GW2011_GWD2_38_11]|nr:MAG: hypothetical protein US70_C0015G0007 [Parcubacteria group bacterium GW2011_GWD2_38_11]
MPNLVVVDLTGCAKKDIENVFSALVEVEENVDGNLPRNSQDASKNASFDDLEQLTDVDLSSVPGDFQSAFVKMDCPEEGYFSPTVTAPEVLSI